jgi:hypothetical protein
MLNRMLISCGLMVGTAAAVAQVAWPAATATNQPGGTLSARPVRLPADVRLQPAARATGPAAGLAGGWRGWGCAGAECDVALVVEDVRSDTATVVFALAAAQLDMSERLQARVVGNELHATLADGSTLHFRTRPDRSLDFLWQRRSDWVGGVLSRDNSTLQERQAAAQRWLARETVDIHLKQPWQRYTIRVRPRGGSTDFLADAGDECLSARVPTQVRFAEPYVLIDFTPRMPGCNFKVQYRAHPVTGRTWAFRSDDGGASWYSIATKADIELAR